MNKSKYITYFDIKIAVQSYIDLYENRIQIYKENKNKSGIYYEYNISTEKFYISSAVSLTGKLYYYLSTLLKLKNYKPSPETLIKLRSTKELLGNIIIVINKKNNFIKKYNSLHIHI